MILTRQNKCHIMVVISYAIRTVSFYRYMVRSMFFNIINKLIPNVTNGFITNMYTVTVYVYRMNPVAIKLAHNAVRIEKPCITDGSQCGLYIFV